MRLLPHITTLLLLFCLSTGISAQQAETNAEPNKLENMKDQAAQKIAALRRGYLKDKLQLTEEESEAFWPVYDEFKAEEKALGRSMKPKTRPRKDISDEEAREMILRRLSFEKQRLELKEKYVDRMLDILPASKLIRLEKAEHSFKMEVMKRLKDRRDGKPGRPGGRHERPGGR